MSCKTCSRRMALHTGGQLALGLALASSLGGALSACSGASTNHQPTSTNNGVKVPNNPTNLYVFDFTTYPALQGVGGSVLATVEATSGSKTISIVRTGVSAADTVSVFCTHQGCQINGYDNQSQLYICPCHGAEFSSAGVVMVGPASSNLPTYTTVLVASGVQVTIA